ncbi:hypothetical protein [Pseudomonas sp. CC6-YY-74]|uniref:hypothetical protein n=1 Tax=Pseudomonas sp. CC6-YY-74 TaxID=1930532 RepID=UPI0009A1D46F|nr:hypothetical protein [Pseudomonas sp. CC6-YY-74]
MNKNINAPQALWSPNKAQIESAQITRFAHFLRLERIMRVPGEQIRTGMPLSVDWEERGDLTFPVLRLKNEYSR